MPRTLGNSSQIQMQARILGWSRSDCSLEKIPLALVYTKRRSAIADSFLFLTKNKQLNRRNVYFDCKNYCMTYRGKEVESVGDL